MSVVEGKRSKGKLTIETELFKFLDFIFNITSKYYLPGYYEKLVRSEEGMSEDGLPDISIEQSKWFAEHMRNEALNALSSVQAANKVTVEDEDDLYERRKRQNEAERSLENISAVATIMYRRKLLKSKRLKYIAVEVAKHRQKIQSWRKSDKHRFANRQRETAMG